MIELEEHDLYFQSPTANKVAGVLNLDREDFAASAAAAYLMHSDNIVEARQQVNNNIFHDWNVLKNTVYKPGPNMLKKASFAITAQAAYETSQLLPEHTAEIENFWFEVGTAVVGAEIQVYQEGIRVECLPITSDELFHNTRGNHDQSRSDYGEALDKLYERGIPLQPNGEVTLVDIAV